MEISRSDVMMGYVERYYRGSLFYTAQNNAKGEELDIIHAIIEDMPKQFNPQTATWGLRFWEEMVGIDGGTGELAGRRNRVMMKLLASQRITPISMERLVRNVTGFNIDIVRNVAPYTFQVLVRDDSLDCDSRFLRRTIEECKEAHMAFFQAYYLGKMVIREQFYFKTVQYMAMYWVRISGLLNGDCLLDGSRQLNTEFPPYDMRIWHCMPINHFEKVLLERLNNVVSFCIGEQFYHLVVHSFVFPWKKRPGVHLNGEHLLDGEVNLDNELSEDNIRMDNGWKFINKESFSEPLVTITHNLWHLDGTVLLDGVQALDAFQMEEVLE